MIFLFSSFGLAYGEIISQELGIVNDLIATDEIVYYFESDKEIKSPTWIPDTKIMFYDGKVVKQLGDKLFMFPGELVQDENFLYFSSLSEDCIGQVQCDFQNLIKVSKKDGRS